MSAEQAVYDRYDPNGPYRAWEKVPQFTLCRDTGIEARNGVCVAHGGDACLFQYVQATALVKELERIIPTKERSED